MRRVAPLVFHPLRTASAATTALCLVSSLSACSSDTGPDPGFSSTTSTSLSTTQAEAEGEASDAGSTTNFLDVMADGESGGTGAGCSFDDHTPCDAVDGDPFQALGLSCPGELAVSGTVAADPTGVRVIDNWGTGGTYTPREGNAFLVLSTGDLAEMNDVPSDPGDAGFHCNSWFSGGGTMTTSFPPPITVNPTAGDCYIDPGLVGTGDCSGTIEAQFNQSGFKYDYQEARFTVTVPPDANSLSFDVAFLTKEYPIWAGREFNDIFVAWMESSTWSGNISFDQQGNPLSLNAAFLEYYDDDGTLPEFAGTCMRYSAGTGWLESSIAVTPGDEITLVFAIFDLDDVNWDSFVFLDNVRWGCDDSGGPTTIPVD